MSGTARLLKLSLVAVLLIGTQACSQTTGETIAADAVSEAYNTSGLMPVQPYNRSIFSSHNF